MISLSDFKIVDWTIIIMSNLTWILSCFHASSPTAPIAIKSKMSLWSAKLTHRPRSKVLSELFEHDFDFKFVPIIDLRMESKNRKPFLSRIYKPVQKRKLISHPGDLHSSLSVLFNLWDWFLSIKTIRFVLLWSLYVLFNMINLKAPDV